MSRKWGNRSQQVLSELDPRLASIMTTILHEVADISLICGFRDQEEQDEAYETGRSKVRWPNGKHNRLPSKAVDFQPWPVPERREKLWASLAYIAGHAIQIGRRRGLVVRWGGDWDGDGDLTDQNFDDLYHLEIKDAY